MGTRIAAGFSSVEEYMPRIGDDEMKRLVKEAIKEWMDDRFAAFGRWSFYGISAAALGLLGMKIFGSHKWSQ